MDTNEPAVLEALWRRGCEGDVVELDALLDAHPEWPAPAFLAEPPGVRLRCALSAAEREAAVDLLLPTYWNEGLTRDRIAAAVHGSTVNVGALDADGRLIAHARALSDGSKWAWIYDVVVAPAWRGRGVGQALMRLLLDHPRVRGALQVLLATRDAQTLYAKFGFRDRREVPPLRSYTSTEMVLRRT